LTIGLSRIILHLRFNQKSYLRPFASLRRYKLKLAGQLLVVVGSLIISLRRPQLELIPGPLCKHNEQLKLIKPSMDLGLD